MKRKWPIIGCKPIPDWLVEGDGGGGDGQGHTWEETGDVWKRAGPWT